MENNNPNEPINKGLQYALVGIAIALSLLVIGVTIFMFASNV
jgi:hypothetical protein